MNKQPFKSNHCFWLCSYSHEAVPVTASHVRVKFLKTTILDEMLHMALDIPGQNWIPSTVKQDGFILLCLAVKKNK